MWFSVQLMTTFIRMSACSWAIGTGETSDTQATPVILVGLLKIINTFTIFQNINDSKGKQEEIVIETLGNHCWEKHCVNN